MRLGLRADVCWADLSWDPDRPLYDIMTEWTVFGGSIFYFSAVLGVYLLRYRRPDADAPIARWVIRSCRLVFIIFYVGFLISMFLAQWQDRLIGLGLIATGAIAFWLWGEKAPDTAGVARES